MEEFFRFPHTPHLAWLGTDPPRGDKIFSNSEAAAFLSKKVTVEEKMDGANLGISLNAENKLQLQNRGHYLSAPYKGQFSRLNSWLPNHESSFFKKLDPNLIAFGEWCAAKHSLNYSNLPDFWILFDIYDREIGRFWSRHRRDEWARDSGLSTAPVVADKKISLSALKTLLEQEKSFFRPGPPEGFVIRQDTENWSTQRAKLVNPWFTQAIEEHWKRRLIEWNDLSK